jgi:anti-sigma regulatory factor (Ser/Thr protein kinase)
MVFQMRCTHLPPLLEEALNANQGYAQRAQVRLTSLCEANCPEVRLDAERFLQVMANLLSNAIKHSHAGDTVSVELTHSAALVQIKVRDQGPGVDPKFRARMFEKFSQADGSDQRIRGGTGLGLYITRMLIDRMGGHIAVDSQPDRGATFIVSLPVLQNASGPPPPWLLHIDRDIDVRRRVASWLSPLYNVKGASDLQQAQDLMAHAKAPLPQASLILADPQAQGLAEAFCATLQHAAKGKPLILLSDTVDAQFVRNQGLRWLPKAETDQAKLLSAVALALKQHLTNKAL